VGRRLSTPFTESVVEEAALSWLQATGCMREADARGEALRLSEDQLASYAALEANDSAVKVLGDETLRGRPCSSRPSCCRAPWATA